MAGVAGDCPPTSWTVDIGYITTTGSCGRAEQTANGTQSNGVSVLNLRLHQCTPWIAISTR